MKNYFYFLALFFFTFAFQSCEKEDSEPAPIASFETNKTSAEIGEVITFSNRSKNAEDYSWNFGDGSTSTDENATHSYSTKGSFIVTLLATGIGGENSVSKTISISYPAPVAGFTMDKTEAKTGELVNFTNTSQNAESYIWDFGDGNTSTEINPTHSYSDIGSFTISLKATGEGGDNFTTKVISITQPPLIGKWIMESCNYNGSTVSGITGWIQFKNNKDYSASFTKGSDYGEATAVYAIENGNEFNTNIPVNIILFGTTFGFNSEGNFTTDILCIADNFSKFGAVSILHTDYYGNVIFSITDGKLVLKSKDDKTKIIYTKE